MDTFDDELELFSTVKKKKIYITKSKAEKNKVKSSDMISFEKEYEDFIKSLKQTEE